MVVSTGDELVEPGDPIIGIIKFAAPTAYGGGGDRCAAAAS